MLNKNLQNIFYGGDYNPDQWPEEIWQEDMRLFKKAGINIVTVPVFSWAKLQLNAETYDFSWLDKVMDLLAKNEIYACLATSTAAQPAWMSKKHPEILPVDFEGRKLKHGARANFCPTSPTYRKFSSLLAKKLAERYKDHPALLVWHINNEYRTYCYCEHCEQEFRLWLQKKYSTLEELNRCWCTDFWGHTIYEWDEINAPSALNEMWIDNGRECSCFQNISLDYNRFMSDSILACYVGEYEEIKKITPEILITTNFMGAFKPLDYFKWAKHMDIISWDNYPKLDAPMYKSALRHDLMRGLKEGQPFMLMEQTPSQQNWQAFNSLKKPGVLRLQSFQGVAHGADAIMYFQLRRSNGACEKFHGALISHEGSENTRVFKECSVIGEELSRLGEIMDSRVKAKVGILFDWENWWAIELSSGPSVHLNYMEQIEKYYKPFYDMNISVDFLSPEHDFSSYEIIIAPVLYMLKESTAEKIEQFVESGGTFVTTFFSGIVDEHDLVVLGGYPGKLRKLMGVWVEEIDALLPGHTNKLIMSPDNLFLSPTYSCGLLCDIIHLEGAISLAEYGQDFYKGTPAITRNEYGKTLENKGGKAYYIGTDPEEAFLKDFSKLLVLEKGIHPPAEAISGVEITQRFKDDRTFTFILNHNPDLVTIDLEGVKYHELIRDTEVSGKISLNGVDLVVLKSI